MKILLAILVSLTTACLSFEAKASGNGLIVSANDDEEAVTSAGKYTIERLNTSLRLRDFSREFYEKSFGREVPREIGSGNTDSLLKVIEKFLISKDGHPTPVISMASLTPQSSGNSQTVFFMILGIKDSPFTGGVLFFSIEKLTKVTDKTYDVSVIPGRMFFGY